MLLHIKYRITFLLFITLLFSFNTTQKEKPVLYLIGDSTVKNGSGRGEGGLWGWGDFLHRHFDTTKISIQNFARGGRSSRTYQTEGLWDDVFKRLKPGDFVIIQFGHNDGGAINDTLRARGTIRGIGDEQKEIYNLITKKQEVVYSFGWYMRKYIRDVKEKGATPIVCSLVARNIWNNGKVERASESFAKWAREVAQAEDAFFIDLNEMVARRYEAIGQDSVKAKLFLQDHTHTNLEGAKLNAHTVASGIREQKTGLTKFLLSNKNE